MTPNQFNIAMSSQYRNSPNLELDLEPERVGHRNCLDSRSAVGKTTLTVRYQDVIVVCDEVRIRGCARTKSSLCCKTPPPASKTAA